MNILCEDPLVLNVKKETLEDRKDVFYYKPDFVQIIESLNDLSCGVTLLGDFVSISSEKRNPTAHPDDIFLYIQIRDIDTKTGQIKEPIKLFGKDAPSRARMYVNEGDLLVSTTRPYRGAISIVPPNLDGCIASTGFAVLKSSEYSDILFLQAFLRSNLGLKQLEQHMTGSNYPAITIKELAKIKIPNISKTTKEQIIRIMQNSSADIKNKIDNIRDIKQENKNFVLTELDIKLISENFEKTYFVKSGDLQKRRDPHFYNPKYVKAHKSLKKCKYPLFSLNEISNNIVSGSTPLSKGDAYTSKEEGVPFIRIVNIKDGEIDLSNVLYIKKEIHEKALKRSNLHPNDLLISIAGTIGMSAVVPNNITEANINQALAKIELKSYIKIDEENVGLNPFYVSSYLDSDIGILLTKRFSRPVVQTNINLKELKSIDIPIPPFEIQNKIVEVIENRNNKINNLQLEINDILHSSKEMVESIILNS